MVLQCVLVRLTEGFLILFLLGSVVFGQIFADREELSNGKQNQNRLRVKRESKAATGDPKRAHSCCDCGGAVYKATFISKWNESTHPNDYPGKLAHFSTVVGGTHEESHVVWELGAKASAEVKRFTEWGDTRSLLNKLSRKKYLGIIKMGPIMKTNKPVSDRFRADPNNHYLSMISKITPSPDWFVGVNRFDLCNATDCSWKNNITIQLRPNDAGTDSGLKFKATNIKSQPTESIHQIMPNFPNHPAASFYNREQERVPPMAEFKIELVHTKGRCSRGAVSGAASNCVVSRWSSWTPCNVQCGRGFKTRGRVVITPARNGGRECPKMTRKKSCRGRNCTMKIDCKVSSWSPWSACSRTCGKGRKTRDRTILQHPRNEGKKCPSLKSRSKCRVKRCPIVHCKVSEWSKWGPCNKSCGKGRRLRSRKLLQEPSKGGSKCPVLSQKQNCNTFECRGRSFLSSTGISGK